MNEKIEILQRQFDVYCTKVLKYAAVQTALKTYERYIRNKCIKTVYDERGLVYYGVDTDKKDFMERRLIHAAVENFKIDR